MQRIAILACVGVLALAGCQQPGPRARLGPPPGPVLSTHAPERIEPIPWPIQPDPKAPPRSAQYAPAVRLTDIRVPGGVTRSKWTTIVVHHAGVRQATPQSMHDYHKSVRKWSNGLGYHFVIGNGVNYGDGRLYVGHRWKQQLTGAHCKSGAGRYLGRWRPDNYFNDHGIGICLIGNLERERPTAKQLETLQELICLLVQEADVNPSHIYGHGEITCRTACPGCNLNMGALRRRVAAALARESRPVHAGTGR